MIPLKEIGLFILLILSVLPVKAQIGELNSIIGNWKEGTIIKENQVTEINFRRGGLSYLELN